MGELGDMIRLVKDTIKDSLEECGFNDLKEEIKDVLPNTVLLDGCIGVAKEVKHQLEEHNLFINSA